MYRNTLKVHMNVTDTRLRRRILVIACLFFFCLSLIFGAAYLRASAYRSKAQTQMSQRMLSAAASAVEEVNRMSGVVASNTSARLSKVRQYVYYMEQLNALSMALAGGESGRLAPEQAFTSLYSDLETFEAQTQAATTSTMETRTLLLTHLTTLQTLLAGQ